MAKNKPAKKTKAKGKINWKLIGKISLIALLVIITILIIALPIYYYWKDFGDLKRSNNPNDWGTFGDFFGGILNPFISLLTLIVTIIIATNISRIEKRNHDETVHSPVKPLFTIRDGDFFSSDISKIGRTVEQDYYDYDPPQGPAGFHDYWTNHFYLEVFNKGLGIANEVNVTFEIDLDELKSLMSINDTRIKVEASDIKTDEDGFDWINLSIQSTHFNYHGRMFKIWAVERDGLGVIDKAEMGKATIPSRILGAFQLYNLIRRLKNEDKYFPTLFVTFDYKNIHGKLLISKFRVRFLHLQDYANYSRYRLIYEYI